MERLTSREPRISGLPGICCTHFAGPECQTLGGCCTEGCLWEDATWERLFAYEDTMPLERAQELAQAEKDGQLVVLPDAKYTDADGEKALQKAMWTCGNTNNPVTRYTAEAIAEKLCREAKDENLPLTLKELREMDGMPVWIKSLSDGFGEWILFQKIDLGKTCTFAAVGATRDYSSGFGKTWLAYRRKPEGNV